MTPKLPQVSCDAVLALLHRLGYEKKRQRGSHIQLSKVTPAGEHRITVPAHKTVAKGTLNDVLTKVAHWNDVSKEELISRL